MELDIMLRTGCIILFNTSGTLVLYRKLESRRPVLLQRLVGYLFLLFLVPLTLPYAFYSLPFVQFLLRTMCLTGYLLCCKRGSVTSLTYCACLGSLSLLSAQNLIIGVGSLLQQHQLVDTHTGHQHTFGMMSPVVTFLILFFLFLSMSSAVPFPQLQEHPEVARRQIFYVCLFVFVLLYIKDNMISLFQINVPLPPVVVIYPIVLSFSALMYVALGNQYHVSKLVLEEQNRILTANEYKYETLKHQLQAQEEVNRVYHDMKNHLLALKGMSNQEQQSYVDGVLSQMQACQSYISTGNQTLDDLLQGKQGELSAQHIQLEVMVDLEPLDFLSPVDICSIFGNAVDNAIEATAKVPQEEMRTIRLKSTVYANQFVFVISNPCTHHIPTDENGHLKTTKPDAKHHGIGLRSIQQSLNRYQGTMTYHVQKQVFSLTMMIPLDAVPQQRKKRCSFWLHRFFYVSSLCPNFLGPLLAHGP